MFGNFANASHCCLSSGISYLRFFIQCRLISISFCIFCSIDSSSRYPNHKEPKLNTNLYTTQHHDKPKVNSLKSKKRYKRGYPVAILLGLEEDTAVLWKVFSKVVKHEKTLRMIGTRNNPKAVYNFHESIVNALRPTLKEGVRSIIVASPPRTNHNQEFINHIYEHHKWLTQGPNKASFSKTIGSISTKPQVTDLTRSPVFRQIICETTAEETENLIGILENRLNASDNKNLVLFSLEEAENLILKKQKTNRPKPDYFILTDRYLAENRQKSRLHRLMQIASTRDVKTRIVNAKSPAGVRLTQLGGFICLAKLKKATFNG
jgi:stalled ribosome rescue protein Dom34